MARSSLTFHWQSTGKVRRSTLLTYRWILIAGQTFTLLAVHFGVGLHLPLLICGAVVAAAAAFNLAMQIGGRRHPMIDEPAAAASLAFDILQIAMLLYLTGGVKNPFAMMILAPITVSASALSLLSTGLLTTLAIALVWALTAWNWPAPVFEIAEEEAALQALGLWVALTLTVAFVAIYTWRVAQDARRLSAALAATATALAREQRVASVGALAAAVAHDLGTPLGTIAITAKELSRELPPDSPLADDIAVIVTQAERCRRILSDLSTASTSEEDEDEHKPYFAATSFSGVVRAAALPWDSAAVPVRVDVQADDEDAGPEPMILYESAAIRRALGLFLQNAAQFARTAVDVTAGWSRQGYTVVIEDDGPGFAPDVLARLGEPFVSGRHERDGHMGLGVFIAVTLLRRSGAVVRFENRNAGASVIKVTHENGARVVITWASPNAEYRG